ncbi:MAG TPA: DUF3604 domain-containing protein [Hyphomicrobiaceae bacterium]|nr:DUF3604 domain-containing protein [Hyphomicrobiaceae bacterium]
MPYSDYRPELMGTAKLEPAGRFEAGSYQSFKLTYTAGTFGIDDTGSMKIGFRFATDFGPVQFDDPTGAGYTTVEASNGASLETRWEFKRNIRPWSRSLYIGVQKHFMKPGDTIIVRFGDRRQGSPGIRLQTYCEREFEFRVLCDAVATYDYVPLPESPKIEIVPGPGVTWHAMLPTLHRAGQPFSLKIRANDKWGNVSDNNDKELILKPSHPVQNLPDVVHLKPGEFSAVVEGLVVDEPGDVGIDVFDRDGKLLVRSNPLRLISRKAGAVHYWGDIHGQSNETLGTNTAEDYFKFGRDKAFLDVMGHQGNDFQITGAFWRHLNVLTAAFDKPGQFVCMPGYEWSANTAVGGDRNVFYRTEGETIHRSSHAQIADPTDMVDEESDAHTAGALFKKLEGKDCVVMAHVGGRYADVTFAHDEKLETAVEVHSAWGTFEWIVQDAFSRGYRVGIVGNSDGHKGRPGSDYPGASFFGSQGGLTCFIAPSLDRDAIFECMRRRHHYATTGHRPYLDVGVKTASDCEVFERNPDLGPTAAVTARQAMMGDIVRVVDDKVELVVETLGSTSIERIDIFDGAQLLETVRPFCVEDLGSRIRVMYEGAEYRGRSRTTVWDGELSVTDNSIAGAAMLNNWNLDRGIQHQSDGGVSWKAVTTGNFGGLDLRLSDAGQGRLKVKTKHVAAELDIASIGIEDTRFDGGGLERAIRVYRLPNEVEKRHMRHAMSVTVAGEGDTCLFVRVTQLDGHRAWSSPIYLFR